MFEGESVYIKLPEADNWNEFKVENNAKIVFTPVFYDETDFLAYHFEEGYPYMQTVQWVESDAVDGSLSVDLDRLMFSIDQEVLVFNGEFEYIYSISEVGSRTEQYDYNNVQNAYEIDYNNVSLPNIYVDRLGNTIEMSDDDILFLKYNSTLPEAISLAVGEMVLQRAPYIENYRKSEPGEPDYVPFAEISLIGINNDGETYDIEDDLYNSRDKLVAWEIPLDLTPFENEFLDSYHQKVFNISFEDIYSDFKKLDNEGIENCYITDIIISSNDPRYQIIVDSFFIFEFDENATLYDSEIFDVYPNNHLEKFYYGDYTDIYSEHVIFDSGDYPPLYYDNSAVNETFYFDAFDSAGNYYYFGEHLFAETVSQGVYNITWNPMYSEHYNAWYYNAQSTEEELEDLRNYYNPHIDKFRYLYLSWADNSAWREWHLIEQPNVNLTTLGVVFEWYNETTEEYNSVIYNQTLTEFETRHIAVESIYPYDISTNSGDFDLSQDYSGAQDLDIYSITGYYFNESEYEFELGSCYIISGEESIHIEAETGIKLNNFDTIIVLINFTSGALSDYSQFRLLDNSITNHPETPAWTKNDSFYVDFEYNDLDYFLLLEDYEVGSENSLFELLEYTRNAKFVQIELDNFVFDINYHVFDYENFSAQIEPKSVLLMTDFNEDGTHEYVVEKHDVTGDGEYNVFKYGYVNPAGEISYHTIISQARPSQTVIDKKGSISQTAWFGLKDAVGKAQRTLYTTTIVNNTVDKAYYSVQSDIDLDGLMDKETSLEVIYSNIHVTTYTKEITVVKAFGSGTLEELRVSTFVDSSMSQTMVFTDIVSDEVVSTRIYEDAFPNELTELNNVENYLIPVVNEIINSQTPNLNALFSLSHAEDNVPAEFDRVTTIENGEITTDNLLFTTQTISIPGVYSESGQGFDSYVIEAIKSIPAEGTHWINDPKGASLPARDKNGYYLYFDSSDDGTYETVFVMDENDKVVGIGFDYDHDSRFHPAKTVPVLKEVLWSKNYQGISIENDYIHFKEKYKEVGTFNEPTLTDVLFDVFLMDFSGGSSALIELAESMATDQFEEEVTPLTMIGDISQQVVAGLVGVAAGVVLTPVGASHIGFMVGYLGTNLLFQSINIIEREEFKTPILERN